MFKDTSQEGCGAIVSVVVVILLFAVYALITRATCLAKTEHIGYPARWELIGGCLIEVKEDQWIPLDQYYFKEE